VRFPLPLLTSKKAQQTGQLFGCYRPAMEMCRMKQVVIYAIGIACCLLLSACAANDSLFHQLRYCNAGNKVVTKVRVQYGKVSSILNFDGQLRASDPPCISNGRSVSGLMPIPKTINVEWTTEDGFEQKLMVPIRDQVKSLYPIHTIQIEFNNEKLRVIGHAFETQIKEVKIQMYP
jgi:hypothetical protein